MTEEACQTFAPPAGREASASRIAVFGGTGFVGRVLAQRWPTEMSVPIYLVHRSEPEWLGQSRVDVRRVDLSDPDSLADAVDGAAVFVNLLRPDGTGWAAGAIEGLMPSLARRSIGRFVHASSIDVYGATREAFVSTSTRAEPQTAYEREHHAIEKLVREAAIDHCIVRLGAVFGQGGLNLEAFVPEIRSGPRAKLAARRALYGRRQMHLVSVENVADALILTATTRQRLPDALIACDDTEEANNFEFVQSAMMARFERKPLDRWPLLPPFVLQALVKARGGDASRLIRRYSGRELGSLGFSPETSFASRIESYAGFLAARESGPR